MSDTPTAPGSPADTDHTAGEASASPPPAPAQDTRDVASASGPVSALTLAALASVAVRGLDPARLVRPQEQTDAVRVVGVVDTRGRHWEVVQALTDAAGASLDAESELLRRLARARDDGRLPFDVSRPAGSLRRGHIHIQVRSHVEGHPLRLHSLRPGPGLSAGLGKALGQLHDLPTSVITESGLPAYDAQEVRRRWITLLNDAVATGYVPEPLRNRWEATLARSALWRFRSTVVHGDLAEENVLTAGGDVLALRGLVQAHVGDPAEDLAWVYATAPVDCLDSFDQAYELARSEGVDKHVRDRAELVSELSLLRWLMHGVRSGDDAIVADAVSMLDDLLTQVASQEPEASTTAGADRGDDVSTSRIDAADPVQEAGSPTAEASETEARELTEAEAREATRAGEAAQAAKAAQAAAASAEDADGPAAEDTETVELTAEHAEPADASHVAAATHAGAPGAGSPQTEDPDALATAELAASPVAAPGREDHDDREAPEDREGARPATA